MFCYLCYVCHEMPYEDVGFGGLLLIGLKHFILTFFSTLHMDDQHAKCLRVQDIEAMLMDEATPLSVLTGVICCFIDINTLTLQSRVDIIPGGMIEHISTAHHCLCLDQYEEMPWPPAQSQVC